VGARFRRSRRGPVTVTFDEVETSILGTLLGQLLDLLDAEDRPLASAAADAGDDELQRLLGISTAVEPPLDPALARLFPDGYRDDRDAAAEFRRYTEQDLREGKRLAVRTARATLGTPGKAVRLDDEQARCWLATLNDLRLAIGTRLEVTEDYDELYASMPPDDPRRSALDVYMWLGHLQETLVHALW
jgi:Domain of unknown function (DUF2017)